MTDSVVVSAFAKINLSLEVLGPRTDGFHELDTVFQSVDLCDRVEVSLVERPGIELEVGGSMDPLPPSDSGNLAWQAASLFLERLTEQGKSLGGSPPPGIRIHLDKQIPIGAGLGGGSSNAAAVLVALAELLRDSWTEPTSTLDLVSQARRLGSDVPYFLVGGTARGTGRGDIVEPMAEIDATELVLIVPGVSVPTAEIFGEYATRSKSKSAAKGRSADRSTAAREQSPTFDQAVRGNDLQEVVFDRYPEVASVYTACQESHAVSVQLSGSGGCVFARFPTTGSSTEKSELLSRLPKGCRVYEARTLSRADIEARRATSW